MAREAAFPQGFTETPLYMQPTDVAAKHSSTFQELRNRGFVVVAGLDRDHVADLTEIASQEGVIEYCANDIKKRWTDEPTAEKQLGKDGGRGVFRLESLEDGKTIGFGWTGASSEDERKKLPNCENTFALRLHEDARGQKLGTPFSVAIVAGSMALFRAKKIGLETWGSNTPAVKSYLGAEAVLITTADSDRPTQYVEEPGVYYKEDEKTGERVPHRRDIREYMQYNWSGIVA